MKRIKLPAHSQLSQADASDLAQALAAVPSIQRAYLFGSRARGTARPGSDVDLALQGPGLQHHHLIALRLALEETNLPYLFDLVILDQAEPAFAAEIRKTALCIWA